MKKIILLIISFISSAIIATAQIPNVSWLKHYGGSKIEQPLDAIETNDGGYLLVGYSYSNDGDITNHHGTTTTKDGWVIKLNNAGNLVWQKSIGGDGDDEFNSVVRSHDNGFICFGTTNSTNGDVVGNNGGTDGWVLKIDKNGNIIWSKCFGTAGNESATLSSSTSDSSYIFLESTHNTLCKLDDNGLVKWQKNYAINRIKYFEQNSTNQTIDVLVGKNYLITDTTFEINIDNKTGDSLSERLIPYGKSNSTQFAKYGSNYAFLNKIYQSGISHGDANCPYPYTSYQGALQSKNFNLYDSLIRYPYGCHVCGNLPVNIYTYNNLFTIDDSTLIFQERKFTAQSCWGSGYDIEYFDVNSTQAAVRREYRYNTPSSINLSSYNPYWITFTAQNDIIPGTPKYFKNLKRIAAFSANDTNTVTPLNDFCFRVYEPMYKNIITGQIYIDDNGNHIKDANESVYPYAYAQTYDTLDNAVSAASFSTLSTSNGKFNNEVKNGQFITKVIHNKKYFTTYPTSKKSIFYGDGGRDTVNFGLVPIPNKTDMQVVVFSSTIARPGFPMKYILRYRNQGTTITSGTIKFVKDPKQYFMTTSPAYTAINGDTLFWDYTNLGIDAGSSIVIDVENMAPPLLNINDAVIVKAFVNATGIDETPYDNEAYASNALRGSYDPNEKKEIHNGKFSLTELTDKKSLLYTVGFQNTGNDTAFNIKIVDTISAKLDISTFEVIDASHPYTIKIINSKYLEVLFKDILLVDSVHDEPNSHGYFTYIIKPKSTLVHNDTIHNTASIYFDYNEAVVTNATHTVIINTALPLQLKSFNAQLNSNKVVNINWSVMTEEDTYQYIVEKSNSNSNFKPIVKINAYGNKSYSTVDEYPAKGLNYYRLNIKAKNGTSTYSNIISVNLNSKSATTIFPNPANNEITISRTISTSTNLLEKIEVFDFTGKKTTTIQLNSLEQKVDITHWQKGYYMFKFENGEVMKFIKN